MPLDASVKVNALSREDELSSIINRRKRKLADLYLVVLSESPIPLSHAADSEQHQKSLALFLEQNDLAKGRCFDESTLPRRPNYASVQASTRPAPGSKQLPPTSSLKAVYTKSPAKGNVALPLTPTSIDPRNDLSNGHDASSQSHAGDRAQDATLVEASHRSGATASDSQNTSQASVTAPNTPQPEETSVTSSTFAKPSAPASPPYSPGTQATRVEGIDIEGSQQMPDCAVNVLTPREDSQDGLQSHGEASLAEQSPVREYDSARTINANVPPPKLTQDSDKTLDDLVASAAVEAPPPGMDVDTNGQAELTRDVQMAQSKDLDVMSKVEAQVDSIAIESQEKHNILASDSDIQGTREVQDFAGPSSTLAPSAISVVSENNLRTDSDGLLPPPKEKKTEKDKTKGGPEKLQDEVFAKQQETMPKDCRDRSMTPMEVDQVHPEVLNPSIPPPTLKPRQSNQRVGKPKHRSRRRKTVVLASAKDERHLEIARHLRKNLGFPEYGSTAYFKPMLKRVILQQNGFKTLDDLVRNNSKKSVNTADHAVAIREEVDFRVLERIRRMQSLEGRWTYKHPARAQEPEPQASHWDILLKDVRWLRTDFREERNFKAAIARDLAEKCAEWVQADNETRKSLQVSLRTASKQKSLTTHQPSEVDVPGLLNDGDDDVSSEDDMFDIDRLATKRLKLDRSLFLSIPEYGVKPAYKDSISTLRAVAGADVDLEDPRLPTLIASGKAAQGLLSTVIEANAKSPEMKPEDITCALFNPESKPLRARLNAPWAFKPPSVSMPPQAFFEHRNASQWTWEDDQMLKQYAKDFPSNWTLIADRLTSRSLFNSYVDRRTPWECYERLLGMEGPPADAQAKQYLRHFHTRIERAKETFDAHQSTIREHTEQQARSTGQPVPNLQPKRFPAPLRVDRKPNKRLVAILDGARKTAKKREIAHSKSQSAAAAALEQQSRPPPPPGSRAIHTPQYWSRVKWERDQRELDRANTMREQQRQIQEATRRQVAAGLPVPNGVVPQVRPPGFVPPQGIPSGITGMPNLANVQNPAQRQVIQQAANANALSGMSAQAMAINNRTVAAQAQLAGAQRLAPQMTGTIANNDNMRRMLAMQQNNAMFNQQQMQAGQLQRQASGNGNNAMNGISNAAMLNQFGNPPMRSPGIPQQQDGTAAHASPHAQQATINRMQPQSLSNGHVPPIVTLQNQVRAANPTYSDAQVNHIAGEQLKQFMAQSAQSRQNAMSATANGNMNRANGSMNASNFAQQQQQQQLQNNNMYSPASNMLGTPQQRAAANQAAQTRNAGSPPHQAVNLLATPTQQQLQQAQSQAQAQLNGQQPGQQSQYSAGIRQQMYNMQRMQQNGNGAAPSTNGNHRSPNQQQISPAAGFVMPVNANVAAGFQRPNGPTTPAAAQQGSMRPPSRTPSSMGVTTQGQHLSPQQQLAQMQRSISNSGGQQQATPQMMQRTMSNGQGRGGMQAQMQRTVSGSGGNGYPMQAMGMGSVSPMPQGMTQQHVQGIMQSGGKMGGQ